MNRNEPIIPTDTQPTSERPTGLDQARLRAALRLCFAAEQADALAGRVVWGERDAQAALAPLVRAARLTYGSERLLSPLRRLRRQDERARPLAPRFGRSSAGALALALHLGLGLDIETLAALFGRPAREISLALHEARHTVEAAEMEPCAEFVEAIGRYRDPAEGSSAERLAFLQHVATCGRCRPALDAARALDERLLDVIAGHERALPPFPKLDHRRRAHRLEPALLWGGVALLLVAIVLAGAIGARRWLRDESPLPLLSAQAASPAFNGWLLQSSESGDISAVNLASGEHRQLIPGVARSSALFRLSPDQRQIARLTYPANSEASSTLTVYGLDGHVQRQWTDLTSTQSYAILCWLNNTTMLVARAPARIPDESGYAYDARAQKDGRLLAFDVSTGAQRVLLTGTFNQALVSPNGQHIVVVRRLSDSRLIMEIRSITADGLGGPLATSQQSAANFIALLPLGWTADNRMIFQNQSPSGMKINSLALDGTVAPLEQPTTDASSTFLSLSPDGTALIYATTRNPGAGPLIYWRLNLTDGTTQKLATSGQGPNYTLISQIVWSPDRAKLALTLGEPFYLPNPAQTGSATSIAAQRVVAFDANGQARGSLLEQFTDQSLLAWLPEDALPERPKSAGSAKVHSDFKTVGLTTLNGASTDFTQETQVSPDGSAVLAYDSGYDFEMAIPLSGDGYIQTAGLPSDPSWLPDSSGTVSVQTHARDDGSTSRIAVYGDIGTSGRSITDYDPAQLGDSTSAAYRYPMLAPDGLHYSFYVVDLRTVTLWIGGLEEPARTVAGWQIPSGARVDAPLIARWVNNATLIYAAPENWHNGLPQQVTLHRVALENGDATDTALINWRPHGSERGLVLRELRIAADHNTLAIRLRHITGGDPQKDAFDSIEAMDTSDLHQSVELARGTLGDGISWSPDGTQLVAVIQEKLTVFTIQGGGIQHIATGRRPVSYPLWVLPNEIWYQSGSDNASQMIRATR